MNSVRPAAILLLLLSVSPARAQDAANLRGDSAQTRKRLVEAEQKLLAGKTTDAIEDLQRVIDEAPYDLIAVDGKQFRTARSVAQGILTRLPPDALKSYQDRIDNSARKLLDAAKRTNDPAPLWQLLERYFVSRPAEEGLLLLGDLLFERGEFHAAERVWQQLLPDAGAEVEYPRSNTDRATVRARLILAAIYQGEHDRARREIDALKVKHPNATGTIAGKSGPLFETLSGILAAPPRIARVENPSENWPTFGGGPNRTSRVAVRLSGEWPARPTWSATIRKGLEDRSPPANPPFSNPVVSNGHAFVTDGWQLFAFDLVTGSALPPATLARPLEKSPSRTPVDVCSTLTAAGDRLFVRVGPGPIKSGEGSKREETAIVCVGVARNDKGTLALNPIWRILPPSAEDKTAVFWEGAPLVAGRRLWAAYCRFEGGRVVHGIACYDPCDTPLAPDRPAWAVDVCDGTVPVVKEGASSGRLRQELLTLAGRNIVFCSNTGAVVALDAATGRRAWAYRYGRSNKSDHARGSDPAPAVFHNGRVFVAPADCDHVLALDPDTGKLLWQSGQTAGARIVGVSGRTVVVATAGQSKDIRGLSVRTGLYGEPDGWIQHHGDGVLGYGAGFVADDAIVWPTQNGLRFLDPHDGSPIYRELLPNAALVTRNAYFGNVIYADGVLVVVTPTEIWGYVSEAKRFGPPHADEESARRPFHRLIERTEGLLAQGDRSSAHQLLAGAARSDMPKAHRAWAAARLLLLSPKADDEAKLPPDLRSALAADLRTEWLIAPDGMLLTLGELLDRHLGRASAARLASASAPSPSERKSCGASTLSRDAEIDRVVRFAAGTAPLRWIPGATSSPKRLYATTNTDLVAVALATGEIARFDSPDRFTHIAEVNGGFVAAGPSCVALFGIDREPLWVFRVPTTLPLPARAGAPFLDLGLDPPLPELSSFRVLGAWLFARLGDRHLIAFDLHQKRVAWVLGADGQPGFHSVAFAESPRFGPTFGTTDQYLLVQLSTGRRWLVHAESGKRQDAPAADAKSALVWWPHEPEEADGKFLVADGAGFVRMVNPATGAVKWTYRAIGEASLTGEPPQVRMCCDSLLVAVRRNHGIELDRLDAADGKSLWGTDSAFLDAERVNLANADSDSERVYVPVGNTLAAFALKDGKCAWETELPDACGSGGWVVRAGQKCIVAYPEAAIAREPVADVLKRLARSFGNEPALWRLPGMAAGAYDAWVARTVPVLLIDPETGKRLSRFEIPATGPAVTAVFERDTAIVATGDRVVWIR